MNKGELDLSYLDYDGELPEKWLLPEERIPSPRNQNNDMQCVAWTLAAIIEIMLKVYYGINRRISTAYIYGDHRKDSMREGEGMTEETATSLLTQDGAVFWEDMPYLIEPEDCYDYVNSHPELQEKAKRLTHLFKGYVVCKAQTGKKKFELMKKALMKYQIPLFGYITGHAIILVGWEDDCILYRDVDGMKQLKRRDYNKLKGAIALIPNENTMPFVDVPEKHWGRKAIEQAYILGLIDGNDKKEIQPDKPCTKAEVIQMMINLYNSTNKGE